MFKRFFTLSAAAMVALVGFLAVTTPNASAGDHPGEFIEGVAGALIELAVESAEDEAEANYEDDDADDD